jgi:Protein of unknown function (DUF4235)
MRLLYKPFALISEMLGKLLGKRAFKAVWTEVDDSPEPPSPTVGEVGMWKAISGAALRAAMIATFVTVLRRLSARAFHNLFGVWPDKSRETENPDE